MSFDGLLRLQPMRMSWWCRLSPCGRLHMHHFKRSYLPQKPPKWYETCSKSLVYVLARKSLLKFVI